MISVEHNINWFLEEPKRLMKMKPFTRGGERDIQGWERQPVTNNTYMETGFSTLDLKPISQDLYITEYRPDLHHIILNQTIPKIKVKFNGQYINGLNKEEITHTASFQKLIHAAHVRNLTANPVEFSLCNQTQSDDEKNAFNFIKQEWQWRNREWNKYDAISTCKKVGNVGVLFHFDKRTGRYDVTNYSFEDGYQIIPNYDEYGREIARSIVYQVENNIIIDTYDSTKHYRCVMNAENGWNRQSELHGFPVCPLLHKRGLPAWEYAESSIEIWEIMTNIQNIALKRFGTFALVLVGEMDEDSFRRDADTLVINLASDTTNGKQDAKVLDFPEPQTMDGYLKTLEEKISLFSSTSFITPKDITTSNSGGNGIALAMSNDYALATQSAMDWQKFVNDMVFLHQCGLELETNTKYSDLKIGAKIVPWSLETNTTKITNLAMEAKWLSTQTIIEKSPDAAPDETERVIKERGALVGVGSATIDSNAEKASNIAKNRSSEIVDNVEPVEMIEQTTINS